MAKKAMSVTLDEANVLWLRGRARMSPGNNVSEALDRLITRARLGRSSALTTATSVVGMVDLSDDPDLLKADAAVRAMFDESLERTVLQLNEAAPGYARRSRKKKRG